MKLVIGGGAGPENVVVGAEILVNRRIRLGEQIIVHEKVFVIFNSGIHPVGKPFKQFFSKQLGTEAGFHHCPVQQVFQAGEMILHLPGAGVVNIFYPAVRESNLMAAVGNLRPGALGIGQKTSVHIRLHLVVSVHKTDPVSRPFRHTPKPGGSNTAVFFVDHLHFGVFPGIIVQNGFCIVCGAVVDRDDLQVVIGLIHQAVQTPGQPFSRIVRRNDHGDFFIHPGLHLFSIPRKFPDNVFPWFRPKNGPRFFLPLCPISPAVLRYP